MNNRLIRHGEDMPKEESEELPEKAMQELTEVVLSCSKKIGVYYGEKLVEQRLIDKIFYPLVPKAMSRESGMIEMSDLKELYRTDSSKILFKKQMEESAKRTLESWEKKHNQAVPEDIKEYILGMIIVDPPNETVC